MKALKIKIADLEDRSRRNNVKFRTVLEAVPPSELHACVQKELLCFISPYHVGLQAVSITYQIIPQQ